MMLVGVVVACAGCAAATVPALVPPCGGASAPTLAPPVVSNMPATAGKIAPVVPVPSPPTARPVLAASEYHAAERLLDARVVFVARGEEGRLAVLADEAGIVAPWRFEKGTWDKLPLPDAHASKVGTSALGMYFGRDNRPRMMGYRVTAEGPRMVYLRHRDGAWQDQRREVGSLASDTSVLFGELGEADPEIVCREGGASIIKGRFGWNVLKSAPPKEAVIRGFAGRGYALQTDGLYVGESKSFVRIGGAAPWKTAVTGFWVGADGAVAVVEPAADALHVFEPKTGVWTTEPSPVRGPRDVAGPVGNRYVVGDEGIAHLGAKGARRIGEAAISLARVLLIEDHVVAAGPAGVFMIRIR